MKITRDLTLRMITVITLAVVFLFAQPKVTLAQQWTTNGNNINNTNTGNVGIGTTAPNAKLEVNHSSATTNPVNVTYADIPFAVRNTSNTNGNFSIISFLDSAGFGNVHIGAVQTDQTAHSADLFFSTRNAGTFAERLRIKANGFIGVGTTSPLYSLDVNGGVNSFRAKAATTSSNDAIATFENSSGIQAIVRGNGYVGIGTVTPSTRLNVVAGTDAGTSLLRLETGIHGGTNFVIGGTANNESYMDMSVYRAGSYFSRLGVTNFGQLYLQPSDSNVGIGTTNPDSNYKLDVVGNVRVSGNIAAKYQDVAEWVPATGALPPGTVVTLNPTQSNLVEASSKAYDTGVAGVISAQPGITLGEHSENKVLVSTTGRVKVKVDATNAPIRIGDLLVTSEQEGVAMKSVPIDVGGVKIHRPGTIIGKALEPLAKGQGEILVLLSLQ